MQIIGSVLVRNEDRFVDRAVRNIAAFCDRIYAHDHVSDDGTWEILQALERDLDHLEVNRTRHTGESQFPLEQYAGTQTWVLGVDGDELYDPTVLPRLREQLLAGEHADVFRLKGHVLNCDELDGDSASGYLAPPSRPITKLFNFAAVTSWSGCSHRLHDGRPVFRDGFHEESLRYLYDATPWDEDPLRCLHVCFLPRSSRDDDHGGVRLNPVETASYDRTLVGRLKRRLRPARIDPRTAELHRGGSNWKRDWYARGERVTVDATPFG